MTPGRLSMRRLGCALLAAQALIRARLSMRRMSETELAALITRPASGRVGEAGDAAAPDPWLQDFSWALQGLARRTLFRANCLVRVLAADSLLRARGYRVEIHLQAGQDDSAFLAHTWLSCEGIDITGGPNPMLGRLRRAERSLPG